MTEESIEDVKQAYALLFKENARLQRDADRYVFLADALTSGDIYNVLQKGFENFDQDRPPTREEFDAGIDAAIEASKETQ